MAMVARSERRMLAGMGAGDNPDLGPGTYIPGPSNNKAGVNTFATPSKPNAASFNSTAYRDGPIGNKWVTPGPGRYMSSDRPSATEVINSSMSSSNFASNSVRFNPKALAGGQPGPGQYTSSEGIGDKAKKVLSKALSTNTGGFGTSQPAISWKRMCTAPSIPAKHQSFGFRKSADTGVVPLKKKNLAKGSTVPSDTQAPKGADWSKSKTDRFRQKKADAYPSTSHEDRCGSPMSNPSRSRMRPPDHSSAASYTETMARKKLEEAAAIPGPGSYAPPTSDFDRDVPRAAGAFGVTAQRFGSKVSTGELGPGEYTDGVLLQTKSMNVKEKHPAALHTTPFGNTAGRFGKQSMVGQAMEGATPGPGAYAKEDTGFITEQHDRQFGRFEGGFGSASNRFAQKSSQYSADVGPGAYEVEPEAQTHAALNRRRHRGGLSCMDSSVTRENVIQKSLGISNSGNQPGPGEYAIHSDLGPRGPPGRQDIPQIAETPFGVTMKRWGDGKSKSTVHANKPGPGAYNSDLANDYLPLRDRDGAAVETQAQPFGCSGERFNRRIPGEGRRTKVPGPGEYSDGVKAATTKWRTPTFNVSIKRTEANAKIVEVL